MVQYGAKSIGICLTVFGLTVFCWALSVVPAFRASSLYSNIAGRILAGEPLRDTDLSNGIEGMGALDAFPFAFARIERASSILKLRYLEVALDKANPALFDTAMSNVSKSLRSTTKSSPADPLIWTFLYWIESLREGISPVNRRYLALSYELGPLEGEVALRRNRLALASFGELDVSTQDRVVGEFAGMVDSRLLVDAALNLVGPGWNIRDRLLASLVNADNVAKQNLIKMFSREGIRLVIPAMAAVEERPWLRNMR